MTRVHIVSLPHTWLTKEYDWCAYTAKVRRFVGMLHAAGNQAIVYGPDRHDRMPAGAEYVPVVFSDDREQWFGSDDWDRANVFDRWATDDVSWTTMNARAALAIRERWQPGDILGLIGGRCQEMIIDHLADLRPLTVEWGIGYVGVIDRAHHVFESYAWAHCVAGLRHRDDIAFFDDVIPNCYSPDEFEFRPQHDGYLLFVGRPTPRKGLAIVSEIAKRVDMPVLHAGQPGDGIEGTEYVGVVTGDEKTKLFAGAAALIAPTTYLEPFGGVTAEAMLSGVPVISTDWGAFTENVTPGLTGRRCRTLKQFLDAVDEVQLLDRATIRDHAMSRWSTDVGAGLYDDYLKRVSTLYQDGWYQL